MEEALEEQTHEDQMDERESIAAAAVAAAEEKGKIVRYAAPSDSGLGTDLPTATLSGDEAEYFSGGR